MTLRAGHLDLELFGLDTGMQRPRGTWSKFNDTRILLSFLESFLRQRWHFVPTEITEEALKAISAANTSFSILYSEGFFFHRQRRARQGMLEC